MIDQVNFESLRKELSRRFQYELIFIEVYPMLITQDLKPYTGITRRLYEEVTIRSSDCKFTNNNQIFWLPLDMVQLYKTGQRIKTPIYNCFYKIGINEWIIEYVSNNK